MILESAIESDDRDVSYEAGCSIISGKYCFLMFIGPCIVLVVE